MFLVLDIWTLIYNSGFYPQKFDGCFLYFIETEIGAIFYEK